MSNARPIIVIPGGGGYLGTELSKYFVEQDFDIVVLSRRPRRDVGHVRFVPWDARTLGPWSKYFEGATAILNLSGRSVNCRYNAANKAEIYASRLDSTRIVATAIAQCENPPQVWLNSSTATIYRHNFGAAWDENGEIGGDPQAKDEFSVDVAKRWEAAFWEMDVPTRRVALRTAIVLGGQDGAFVAYKRIAQLGLGGALAGGKQWMSWVHIDDFCRAVAWIIEHTNFDGVVNVAAPNPLPQSEFMRELRRALNLPIGLPAPLPLLEIGAKIIGTETELLIKSRRVMPSKLLDSGFEFNYPNWPQAADVIVNHK